MVQPPIVVPVPTFRDRHGLIDQHLSHGYARCLATTWVQHVITSGPTGLGEYATDSERALLLDLWLEHVSSERLMAACWTSSDTRIALGRGVRPLIILRAHSRKMLVDELAAVPDGALAYVNPRYSRAPIEPQSLSGSSSIFRGSGLKLSKVTFDELAQLRAAVGPDLRIIHGSSRAIADSLAAGANLVTAAPLAAIPTELPNPAIAAIQRRVDGIQAGLDMQNDHLARVAAITDHARQALASP